MALFRVRLNCIDNYQATPTDLDPTLPTRYGSVHQSAAPKVPVIRIFGATETGQKVCAHVHGALPYLYIEYQGSLDPPEVEKFIHRLHHSIDHALAVSYRRNVYDGKSAYVAHVTIVKGIPFYGYHVGYKFFLKIYLLNPLHMTRLADLLRQGAIMKRSIQPYESHMQYLAQWMCDYNLYGCAYVDCNRVKFRSPVPDYLEMTSTVHLWHDRTITADLISDENQLPRQSHCPIEVDICVQDIMNRLAIKPRPLHHDFIERTEPLSRDEKLVNSMASLWRDETRRRKAKMGLKDPNSSPFPPEVLISMSADPRHSQPGGWIHEREYMEKVDQVIAEEQEKAEGGEVDFNNYVQVASLEGNVKTVSESVKDLYPENLPELSMQQTETTFQDTMDKKINEDLEVDTSRIGDFEEHDFPYGSDEDRALDQDLSRQGQADHIHDMNVNGISNERKHDDEAWQDGARYVSQSEDSKDHEKQPSAGPSENLAEIKDSEVIGPDDVVGEKQDVFQIPFGYVGEITSTSPQHQIHQSKTADPEPPKKKRKVVHDERPTSRGASNSYPIIFDDRTDGQGAHRGKSGFGHSFDSRSTGEESTPQHMDSKKRPTHTTPIWQKTLQASGSGTSPTVSYSMVKDPHDPNTIQRLNQKRIQSMKVSPVSQSKINSFNNSAERKQDPSIKSKSSFTKSASSDVSNFSYTSKQAAQIVLRLCEAFEFPGTAETVIFAHDPPQASEVASTMRDYQIPSVVYQDAYYGDEHDAPDKAREYAGKEFKLGSRTVPYLPVFDTTGALANTTGERSATIVDKHRQREIFQKQTNACGITSWEIAEQPPSRAEVRSWLDHEHVHIPSFAGDFQPERSASNGVVSQIEGPTQRNRHGFKCSQKRKSTSVCHETQYMSVMSLEVHLNTRGNLLPDPERDEIACVFWCLQSDDEDLEVNGSVEGTHVGILALSEDGILARKISQQTVVEVEEESTELGLINRMVDIVRYHDPDILTGYEVHGGSWGYMIERARYKYDFDLCDEFSRMKSQSHGRFGKDNDSWGFNHTSTIRVTGRHMINIWRAMRGELNLLQYTMENVVFHLLHRRIPHYSHKVLTTWYCNHNPRDLAKMLDYYLSRVQIDLEILEQNELIPRTSEQARLLGVDFFSVFSRGSQFKVESLMFRIAKPESFVLISPSRKQVGQQNALECLPLVMEPQSAFYTSPVLVLDFQSLYPSVMIAYNYCYSTFLGRVVNWRGQNKMGFTDFKREDRLLGLLKDYINIAPNGMLYVKPGIRKSLLAKMLGEILETRVMVKSGMKVDRDDKALQRLLNNRQLALKLIANVTYGYTSASFSGRMPCSEIADSIVQTGRETLEKAIAMIHSVERWGAEVVYGDTDSLFVHLKGRTKDEAFDIGNEIVTTITKMNPRPVKLKFEKVYLPCILLAKKRYVGFKHESKTQIEPEFDAKGIETVRRDGTPAEQKIEEKALKIFFRTADLSQVKQYFQKQCTKIMKGKVSIQDFCFAKEVKLGTYSDKGLPPPGALISTKRMLEDPRAEPQYGERVPYVVIAGAPGARLVDRSVAPDVLLHNESNELDVEYYISKNIIPPLERIFNLVGANVRQWYDEVPKFQRIRRIEAALDSHGKDIFVSKKTLESYMRLSACLVCREKLEAELPVCGDCLQRGEVSLLKLRSKMNNAKKKAIHLGKVCRSCAGLPWGDDIRCDSKDCPVFYSRARHIAILRSEEAVTEPVIRALEENASQILDW